MKNLLILRLAIFNIAAFSLLAWAAMQGYVEIALTADTSGICYVIVAVFLFGLASSMVRAVKVSRLLNAVKEEKPVHINREKLLAKQAYLSDISTLCEKLCMFGTIVGFLIAFYGIDPSGDPKAIMSQILVGLAVAFFTTAVGFCFGTWLGVMNRMIWTASISLVEDSHAGK